MDFIVVVLITSIIGLTKINKNVEPTERRTVSVMNLNETVVEEVYYAEVPIGSNLRLNREVNAFMKIPKQFGLVR